MKKGMVSRKEYSFSIFREKMGPFLSPSLGVPFFYKAPQVKRKRTQEEEQKKKGRKEECAKR